MPGDRHMRLTIIAFITALTLLQPAHSQSSCPTGEELKKKAIAADDAYTKASFEVKTGKVPSSVSKRARAYAYLTYAGVAHDAAFEDVHIFMSPVFTCHTSDCPTGIDLTSKQRKDFKAVSRSEVDAYVDGTPALPWAPVLKTIPTEARIAWAEGVLNCSVSGSSSSSEGVTITGPIYSVSGRRIDTPSSPPPPQSTRKVQRIYGEWAIGSGHYCRNNEFQTDGYAMANARQACRKAGGSDGGTYIANGGYDAYKPSAEQCYQARAYTDCVFD